MPKPLLVLFGGVSAEHEVSVVTGLQALEHVDRTKYEPLPIYVTKTGEILALPGLASRKGFLSVARKPASFGRDTQGGYLAIGLGLGAKKVYPYAAYMAFHGGTGEGGPMQGLLESVGIPFTSTGQESSVIVMNKWLTKSCVAEAGLNVVPAKSFLSERIQKDVSGCVAEAVQALGLPVILKPVHLGSSIGITVARTETELQKGLLEAAFTDTEVLVEKFLSGFVEYNCAIRRIGDVLETSEIEEPISNDEILSFADKYERGGGKKTGGQSGMASLERKLPADITPELKRQIQEAAKAAFTACRMKSMTRIDFMLHEGTLYLTEINPIPGSMAFYLWEASGMPFTDQITDMVEQACTDAVENASHRLDYQSDIIERFVVGS